ncbi:MAG: HEAT repeat domain-containing protein [Anaerolineae bacterium]
MSKEEKSFDEILDSLFEQEPFPVPMLFKLTDLTAENLQLFHQRWPEVENDRRRVLVRHLVDISEEDFSVDFEPVFIHCLQDASSLVRVAALDGLWDSENTQIISTILDILTHDEDQSVRAAAAAALAHYVVLIEWEQLPEKYFLDIVDGLLAAYDSPESSLPLKRAALESLGAATHERVSELISDAYGHEDRGLQLSAVFAMGNSANERWLPTVMDEMESPFMEMRAEAARAAGSIGKSTAVPSLINLIADEETDVAITAVQALGQIGGDNARQALEQLIDDPDFEPLQETIEDALEEIIWLTQMIDMMDEFEIPDDPSLN